MCHQPSVTAAVPTTGQKIVPRKPGGSWAAAPHACRFVHVQEITHLAGEADRPSMSNHAVLQLTAVKKQARLCPA